MSIGFLNLQNGLNIFKSGINVNKINNSFSNPIYFKGNDTKDTVDFSTEADKINTINKKIQSAEAKKVQLEIEYEKTRENLNALKAQFDNALEEYGEDDERTRELSKQLTRAKTGKGIQTKIKQTDEYIQKLKQYIEAIKATPDTAFLHDPDTTMKEKEAIALKTKNIKNIHTLAKNLSVPIGAINCWNKAGCLDVEYMLKDSIYDNEMIYINTTDEKNARFLDSIKDELKTSLSGNEINKRYTITPATLRKAITEGKLEAVGIDTPPEKMSAENAMFNMKNETNKRFFRGKTYGDLHYFSSIGKEGTFIPAAHLEKLGYGTVHMIRKNIQAGYLPGKIETVETPEGKRYKTLFDASNYLKTKDFLIIARDQNPDVVNIKNLAQELGINQSRIKEAIENGEVEIINEYLIAEDRGKIYLKRSNPKNALFIEKALFEKMMTEELRAKEKEERQQANIERLQGLNKQNSLRMKLARNMCKHTREVASNLAKQDGYLCTLLIKEDEGKELTRKEKIKINSYRKKMWSIAGTEELSAALKKAWEYMNEYYQGGIEAVSDDEAKEIIKMYYPD